MPASSLIRWHARRCLFRELFAGADPPNAEGHAAHRFRNAFAVSFLEGVALSPVYILLGQAWIRITGRHHAPRVRARLAGRAADLQRTWSAASAL